MIMAISMIKSIGVETLKVAVVTAADGNDDKNNCDGGNGKGF